MWIERASLPSAAGSSLATTIGTRALIINGQSLAMDIYESLNDTWSVGPTLLTEALGAAVSVNNKAMVVGYRVVQIYAAHTCACTLTPTPFANTWTLAAPLPFVPSTAVTVGNITIFPNTRMIFSVIYNSDNNGTQADTWQEGPTVGGSNLAVTLGTNAYFISDSFPDHYLRIYSAANKTLMETEGFRFSWIRFSAAAAAVDKVIFASDIFHIFDTVSNTWSTGPSTDRTASMSAASTGTKAIFAGGLSVKNDSDSNYTISAIDRVDIYDAVNGTFTAGPPLAGGARYFLASANVGSKVLFAGGQKQIGTTISGRPIFGASDAVDIYDSVTDTWSSGVLLPGGPRFAIVSLTLGARVIFAGGFNGSAASCAVDVYDSITQTWSQGAPLLMGGTGLAAALNDTAGIFVLSGVVQIYTENGITSAPSSDPNIMSTTSAPTSTASIDPTTVPATPSSAPTSDPTDPSVTRHGPPPHAFSHIPSHAASRIPFHAVPRGEWHTQKSAAEALSNASAGTLRLPPCALFIEFLLITVAVCLWM